MVGSSTTVLTAALAGALREAGPGGPALLLPWATALRSGEGGPPLLEMDPGRTFRFCPNNDRLADSVVDGLLLADAPRRPARAIVVVDPLDPYSVDLAASFRRAILARAPSAEIVEEVDALGEPPPRRPDDPGPPASAEESRLAEAIWRAAGRGRDGGTTWVVLPLQEEPALRVLASLRGRSPWPSPTGGDGPIRVVSGDAIRRRSLEALLAGRRVFPVWCASTASPGADDEATQTLAEIVSSLLLAVERSPRPEPTADDVRDALAALDLPASSPSAFGRALAFEPGGERRGEAGAVLAARPGQASVAVFGPGKAGGRP